MKSNRSEPDLPSKYHLFKRYMSFLKPYTYGILWIIALGMLSYCVPLVIPWMTKILIDDVLPGRDGKWTLESVVLVLVAAQIFGVLLQFLRNYYTAKLGNRIVVDLRYKLYQHMQTLSQRFFESRQTSSIVSRVLNDVNGAQNMIGGGVINLVIDVFMVVFAAAMLFALDMKLALLSLWLLPLFYLTFTNLNVRIRFAYRYVHRELEKISGLLVERIGGIKIVQAFGKEKAELDRYEKQAINHYKHSMSANVLSNTLGAIVQSSTTRGRSSYGWPADTPF